VWTVNGQSYTVTGTDTVINDGCTANEVLNLTVIEVPADEVTVAEICSGEVYVWSVNGQSYTETGTYVVDNDGCTADQVLNLTVIAKPADVVTIAEICSGETYVWTVNGQSYTVTGTDTVINDGCTADQVLNLTVIPKPDVDVTDATICVEDGYLWCGEIYTIPGTYEKIAANVCDSDSILNLTVVPLGETITDVEFICEGDSLTWDANGVTYFTDTLVMFTLPAGEGCQVRLLDLSVTVKLEDVVTDTTICEGQVFVWEANNNAEYSVQSTYTVPGAGCEADLVLNLTVTPKPFEVDEVTVCIDALPYVWFGNEYDTEGTYSYTALEFCEADRELILTITTECAELGNKVWIDDNANGIQDPGEQGLPGTIVELFDISISSATPIATMMTDSIGCYLFTGLSAGDYFVKFTYPTGYSSTVSNNGMSDADDSDVDNSNGDFTTGTIPLLTGQSDLSWDAGVVTGAKIGNFVWLDNSGLMDNVQDANDTPLEGITVTLYLQDAFGSTPTIYNTTMTDENGEYCFNNVLPTVDGNMYFLEFEVLPGYNPVLSDQLGDEKDSDVLQGSGGRTDLFPVLPGQTNLSFDAGFTSGVLALVNTTFRVMYYEKDNYADLSWITTNEDNIEYYVLEKAFNTAVFNEMVNFDALGYNDAEYNVQDEDLAAGVHYYRLKVVGTDGIADYSKIVAVEVEGVVNPLSVSVFPNPVVELVNVKIDNYDNQEVQVVIFDESGRIVEIRKSTETDLISIDCTYMTPGNYFVRTTIGEEVNVTKITVIR